jgi:hypothetical protein
MIPIDFGHVLIVLKSHVVSQVADPLMTSFPDFRVADGRSLRRNLVASLRILGVFIDLPIQLRSIDCLRLCC